MKPNFHKKKTETVSHQKSKETRYDTQANLVDKRHPAPNTHKKQQQQDKPQKTHKMQRCITSKAVDQSMVTVKAAKTTLYIKELLKTLWGLKEGLEKEYDELLNGMTNKVRTKEVSQLLCTDFFRFRPATYNSVLDQYLHIIQACELLISKLTNNEKLSEKVLIKNQQDFVLFFKFFFSKPYTLINLPAVRKIIKLLWDQFLFSTLTIPAMLKNIQLWVFGIAAPLNPSMNKLHKYCSDRSQEISKFVTHKSNAHVYIGVNDSDSLGLTPLMVAAIAKNIKAIEKLIKNGADIYCCPLTTTSKNITELIEKSKYGNKTMIKKQFGFKDRRQPNVIEYLKQQKKLDWIAHIFCWENFYHLKKFKKDSTLSDRLEMFPDCSFQLDWKQYRGMLCFKQLPSDMITVSKREHSLRLDFHTTDLTQNSKKKGFYTLLLRAQPKQQNKLYLISHNQRTIRNVLQDKDIVSIKEKYSLMMKHGNVYQYDVSQLKSIYFPEEKRLSSTMMTYHQNCSQKTSLPKFRNQQEYFNQLVNSELINYGALEKDELKAILEQKAIKVEKGKFKHVQSACTVDVEWAEQDLKLSHLQLLIQLAQLTFPQSLLLTKLAKTAQIFEDPIYSSLSLRNKLPLRCKWSSEGQINLQCQIKNLYYMKVDPSVFNLEVRAKEMQFEEMDEGVELSHLQDTVYMDEMYSISASRFMGKSELQLQLEDDEANRKFEELQKLEGLWSADDED